MGPSDWRKVLARDRAGPDGRPYQRAPCQLRSATPVCFVTVRAGDVRLFAYARVVVLVLLMVAIGEVGCCVSWHGHGGCL
jgi:hypothetical protein